MNAPESSFASSLQELELLFLLIAGEYIVGAHPDAYLAAYQEETGQDIFSRILHLLDVCEQDLAARAAMPDGIADAQRYDYALHRALVALETQLHRVLHIEQRKFPKPDRTRVRTWIRLGIRSLRRTPS